MPTPDERCFDFARDGVLHLRGVLAAEVVAAPAERLWRSLADRHGI